MIIMVRDGMGLNFISITYSISRLWLVGPVSEKMDVAISNLFSLFEVYYQPPYQISSKSDGKHGS